MDIVHAGVIYENGYPRFKEINGFIKNFEKFDIQLSLETNYQENDFELVLSELEYENRKILIGDWIYIPNSEWGGRVESIRHENKQVYLSGPNFRYYIGRTVVYPPYNSNGYRDDYLYISNLDGNAALQRLKDSTVVKNTMPFYTIKTDEVDIKVNGQFRYVYFNDAVNKLFSKNNLRLKVYHSYQHETPLVMCAELKVDRIEKLNKDYDLTIDSKVDESNKVNFIVGLGKGELHEREVVFMQKLEDGTIIELDLNATVIGMNQVNEFIYDNSSVESIEELKESMIEKFEELDTTKTIEVGVRDDLALDLGDILKAKDNVTNLEIETQVIRKTLTIQNGRKIINYKVGEI